MKEIPSTACPKSGRGWWLRLFSCLLAPAHRCCVSCSRGILGLTNVPGRSWMGWWKKMMTWHDSVTGSPRPLGTFLGDTRESDPEWTMREASFQKSLIPQRETPSPSISHHRVPTPGPNQLCFLCRQVCLIWLLHTVESYSLWVLCLPSLTEHSGSTLEYRRGASLVVQRWRLCLPTLDTKVLLQTWEDLTGCRAAKPECHSYWSPSA